MKNRRSQYMNTDYNNNYLSFQAKVQLNTNIKDAKRLMTEIAPIFERKTANYPNDTLKLSKNGEGSILDEHLSFHLSDEKAFDEYRVSVSDVDVEDLMQRYDNETVAQKLFKVFKSLKRETTYDNNDRKIDFDINRANTVIRKQRHIIDRYKRLQKDDYAKPFETIVAMNEEKIAALNKQKKIEANKFVRDLKKIAGDDPDIAIIPKSWEEVFNFLGKE